MSLPLRPMVAVVSSQVVFNSVWSAGFHVHKGNLMKSIEEGSPDSDRYLWKLLEDSQKGSMPAGPSRSSVGKAERILDDSSINLGDCIRQIEDLFITIKRPVPELQTKDPKTYALYKGRLDTVYPEDERKLFASYIKELRARRATRTIRGAKKLIKKARKLTHG